MEKQERIYSDVQLQYIYDCGYDAGKNGANTQNSNFTLFSNPDRTEAWEKGHKKGKGR